jgi:signal transduction histidine kinase/CheY-like chemotaxis protein
MPADAAAPRPAAAAPKRSLLRRYLVSFAAVVGLPLAGYTAIGAWSAASDHRDTLVEVQRTNAEAAAFRITQFVREIEGQLRWATHLSWDESDAQRHRLDALRLLRQVPAVTDLALIDGAGRERLFVSRVSMDRSDARTDRSGDDAVRGALARGTWYGPVYFRRGTEPFITVALAGTRREAGVVVAEVNLKYSRDVVSGVRVGQTGRAYVVDGDGRLIAHPDVGLVLRNTDLGALVRSLDAQPAGTLPRVRGPQGDEVLVAQALAPPLDWRVLVELPVAEADAPLQRVLTRSLWVTAGGLLVALGVALVFSWRMIRPIRVLIAGAERIGAGQLDHRIAIATGDEIEQLGAQFNTMAGALERSYAGLERQVEERTRELSDANRAKSRFLAAASHDLRQPLHALNLLVAQLRAEASPQERERIASRIESAVAGINGLFDGLLDISKLDAGVVGAELADFPVQRVLDRMEAAFAADAAARGLRLRVRPSAAWVRSDPVLLERIAGNLVGNALRYTRTGGILVGCRQRGDTLRLEVWDTGIGIPADQHAEIFGEFVQVAPAGGLRGEGLGLGLAIVARLAAVLGHTVQVASRPARGSCFAVTLPAVPPVAQAATPSAADGAGVTTDPLRGRRVLVVDNDDDVLHSTAGLLRSWGCVVDAAASAGAALAGGEAPPELVVSDLHLGDGDDGLALVAALRERHGAELPAFIVSGDLAPQTRARVAAAGLPFAEKPVPPMRLRALVTRSLRPRAAPGL